MLAFLRLTGQNAPDFHQAITRALAVIDASDETAWTKELAPLQDLTAKQDYRLIVPLHHREETRNALLERLQQTDPNPNHKIAFLCAGQGAQRPQMASDLIPASAEFDKTITACAKVFDPHSEVSLNDLLTSDEAAHQKALNQTGSTQPALFAYEVALGRLWQQFGLTPSGVMGHSVGEFAAAVLAGVYTLEEGLQLIQYRAQKMQSLPEGGGMLAMLCDQSRAETLRQTMPELASVIDYAAFNTPNQTVLSGPIDALSQLAQCARQAKIKAIPLQVSHAFHSHLMDPILDDFEAMANSLYPLDPTVPLISNVHGKAMLTAPNGRYWRDHIRQPVQFMQGLTQLIESGCQSFVEIGPQAVLVQMGEKTHGPSYQWIASQSKKQDSLDALQSAVIAIDAVYSYLDWSVIPKVLAGFDL